MDTPKKHIYVFTHGDKHKGANPGMTENGFAEIRDLRHLLPENIAELVWSGTGQRHKDVAIALNLRAVHVGILGKPDSMEIIDGNKTVLFADGRTCPLEEYEMPDPDEVRAAIISLPDNTVICTGRPLMMTLGVENAKSAAVYEVVHEDGEIISTEEVVATGVSEAGTV